MLRFTLFGIPVVIQPWFWATVAFLGGALRANTADALLHTVLFMVVATVSILVHEFGHALTGRRLGGGNAHIVLWAFGGLAYNQGGRFTRWQRFWMVFMGPGAGFLFLAAIVFLLCIVFGVAGGLVIFTYGAFGEIYSYPSERVLEFLDPGNRQWWAVSSLIWVNFWWGLINLVPVFPLDGGRIAEIWIRPLRRVHLISTICAAALALIGVAFLGSIYMGVLFGYLAYKSYQQFKQPDWA